ncbi:MAG: deoxynucleoside kinase, partial [Clostridium sp.]|nr:deoxynucleoside kinase [Clostridium sp.]
QSEDTIIQDRTIFEDARIFAPNLHDQGMMSDRDFQNYTDLFDLMIYLRASVPHLVGNIQQRGRDYEQTMKLEYLENLNRRYDDFIYNKYRGRVMTVEKDGLDFKNDSKDLAQIIDRIDSQLFGLFPDF